MNAAESFVATLKAWGVRYFFGLPGSTEAALLEALRQEGSIRYVLGLHESIPVAMADGYARASGQAGVVGLHTSVGSANGLGMIYNAWRDSSPVVVTAGHKETAVLARDGFCAMADLPGLARNFTKWAWQSLTSEQVAEDLRRALHVATAPPAGPVYLAVPEDLLSGPAAVPASAPRGGLRHPTPRPDAQAVQAAAALLAESRLPVLVAGAGIAQEGAWAEAVELAEQVGMALVWEERTGFTAAAVPSAHPHFLGCYGEEPALLEQADLLLAVGARMFLDFSLARAARLPPGAKLIHAHPVAAQVGWQHAPAVGMVAGARATLRDLAAAVAARGDAPASRAERRAAVEALAQARRRRLDAEAAAEHGRLPAAVSRVARELRAALPPDAVVVDESVRSAARLRAHFPLSHQGRLLSSGGGALGWGLPAALGVQLAWPGRPVVAVVGDGALHFSVQALWTAARHALPVVVVVLNNGGYMAVKRAIEAHLGGPQDHVRHPGTDLPGIDHCAVARGYGARATRVSHPDEIGPAVRAALESRAPHLIEIPVEAAR